jgi:hypothetical protein
LLFLQFITLGVLGLHFFISEFLTNRREAQCAMAVDTSR